MSIELTGKGAPPGGPSVNDTVPLIRKAAGATWVYQCPVTLLGSTSLFTATTAGLVGPSGGGTTTFLRADGQWAVPPVNVGYILPVATSTVLGGVKQGTGVTIAGDGTISASGSTGSGTINAGTANQLGFYASNGTTITPLTLGTNLSITGTTLNATGGSGSTALTIVTIDGTTIVGSTSNPYQMLAGDRVVDVNKTTGAPTRILLPTNPTLGVEYTIIDGKRDAGTNNITIVGNINGATSLVLNQNEDAFSLRPVSANTWRRT